MFEVIHAQTVGSTFMRWHGFNKGAWRSREPYRRVVALRREGDAPIALPYDAKWSTERAVWQPYVVPSWFAGRLIESVQMSTRDGGEYGPSPRTRVCSELVCRIAGIKTAWFKEAGVAVDAILPQSKPDEPWHTPGTIRIIASETHRLLPERMRTAHACVQTDENTCWQYMAFGGYLGITSPDQPLQEYKELMPRVPARYWEDGEVPTADDIRAYLYTDHIP